MEKMNNNNTDILTLINTFMRNNPNIACDGHDESYTIDDWPPYTNDDIADIRMTIEHDDETFHIIVEMVK